MRPRGTGSPASEAAVRYGVSRQSVHSWRDKYQSAVGGIYSADGREYKMLSGIDDHSMFVVCSAVLADNGMAQAVV